jgi:hypothetical protein
LTSDTSSLYAKCADTPVRVARTAIESTYRRLDPTTAHLPLKRRAARSRGPRPCPCKRGILPAQASAPLSASSGVRPAEISPASVPATREVRRRVTLHEALAHAFVAKQEAARGADRIVKA